MLMYKSRNIASMSTKSTAPATMATRSEKLVPANALPADSAASFSSSSTSCGADGISPASADRVQATHTRGQQHARRAARQRHRRGSQVGVPCARLPALTFPLRRSEPLLAGGIVDSMTGRRSSFVDRTLGSWIENRDLPHREGRPEPP
jgi:hypothetical protein